MARHCCGKDIQTELNSLTEKLKVLKQEYQKLLIENLQKDLLIRQIKARVNKNSFIKFEEQLSKTCIDKLDAIGESQREDSQFVAEVLFELYNGNIETIKNLSLSGRSKSGCKIEISPEKKEILATVFAARLSKISTNSESRKNSLSKLIRNAIDNVNRK